MATHMRRSRRVTSKRLNGGRQRPPSLNSRRREAGYDVSDTHYQCTSYVLCTCNDVKWGISRSRDRQAEFAQEIKLNFRFFYSFHRSPHIAFILQRENKRSFLREVVEAKYAKKLGQRLLMFALHDVQ